MNRDTYRQGLAALLTDADRLGSTPDELAARAVVLAELRHAIADGLVEEPAPVEQQPPPDGDDWLPWSGGKCPCPDWPEVEYEMRNGYGGTVPPAHLRWDHYDNNSDIIAYRRPRPMTVTKCHRR